MLWRVHKMHGMSSPTSGSRRRKFSQRTSKTSQMNWRSRHVSRCGTAGYWRFNTMCFSFGFCGIRPKILDHPTLQTTSAFIHTVSRREHLSILSVLGHESNAWQEFSSVLSLLQTRNAFTSSTAKRIFFDLFILQTDTVPSFFVCTFATRYSCSWAQKALLVSKLTQKKMFPDPSFGENNSLVSDEIDVPCFTTSFICFKSLTNMMSHW